MQILYDSVYPTSQIKQVSFGAYEIQWRITHISLSRIDPIKQFKHTPVDVYKAQKGIVWIQIPY